MMKLFHTIKSLLNAYKENRELRGVIDLQNDQIDKLSKPSHPADFIKMILDGKVDWYDYKELPQNERDNYEQSAAQLLRNPVFRNEINKVMQQTAVKALSEDTKDLQVLRDLQITAVAIKSLEAHIELCAKPPESPPTTYDKFEVM